jgi:hypothetical protein
VGATLFRLLCGEYVHAAPGLSELLDLAMRAPARSLGLLAPGLPEPLISVIDRALAFEIEDRFDDARSMRRALRKTLPSLASPGSEDDQLSTLVRACEGARDRGPEAPTHVDLAPRNAVTIVDRPQIDGPAPVLAMSRHDVLSRLDALGIRGSDVRLLDTVPLIEMIWADGRVQAEERALLDEFLRRHVKNVNELAGAEVLTLDQARAFVARFLTERPDPELMRTLREMLLAVGDDGLAGAPSRARRRAILDLCLDVGAACVAEYPHGDHERFCRDEKALFEEIFRALSV